MDNKVKLCDTLQRLSLTGLFVVSLIFSSLKELDTKLFLFYSLALIPFNAMYAYAAIIYVKLPNEFKKKLQYRVLHTIPVTPLTKSICYFSINIFLLVSWIVSRYVYDV